MIDEDRNYLETKLLDSSEIELSIKTKSDKKSFIVTAKLNENILDKLISELISLKSQLLLQQARK